MKIWKSKKNSFGWQEKIQIMVDGSIIIRRYLRGKQRDYIWIQKEDSKKLLKFMKDNL